MDLNTVVRLKILLVLFSFSILSSKCDPSTRDIEPTYIPAAVMSSPGKNNLIFFAVSTGLKYRISCNPAFLDTNSKIKMGFFYYEYRRMLANTTLTFVTHREIEVNNTYLHDTIHPTLRLHHGSQLLNEYDVNHLTCNFLIHFVSPTMMEIRQISDHFIKPRKSLPIQLSEKPLLEFALAFETAKSDRRSRTSVFVSGIPKRKRSLKRRMTERKESSKNVKAQTTVFRDILIANLSISLFTFFLVVSGFAGIIVK